MSLLNGFNSLSPTFQTASLNNQRVTVAPTAIQLSQPSQVTSPNSLGNNAASLLFSPTTSNDMHTLIFQVLQMIMGLITQILGSNPPIAPANTALRGNQSSISSLNAAAARNTALAPTSVAKANNSTGNTNTGTYNTNNPYGTTSTDTVNNPYGTTSTDTVNNPYGNTNTDHTLQCPVGPLDNYGQPVPPPSPPSYNPPAYGNDNKDNYGPPVPPPPPPPPSYNPPVYEGGNKGNYWGDPHLEGFDGEKYDVMGEAGKTYNMLSDKDVQYNATFEQYGDDGATVIGQAGIQVGNSKVAFDRSGNAPTVNEQAMIENTEVQLDKGGLAKWDGTSLLVNTGEYTINLKTDQQDDPKGSALRSDVSINEGGPFQDLVAPHGLLGQTADGVQGQKDTGVDQGKQGGTVIDGTVNDYEVSTIWSTDNQFNRFGAEIGEVIQNPTDGSVSQVMDTAGNTLLKVPA